MWAEIKKSATLKWAFILALLGALEDQFQLLAPVLGEKAYGIIYFGVLTILSMARMKGIKSTVKAKRKSDAEAD
jgi:hypothetical protein